MQAQVVRLHADWLAGTLLDFATINQGINAQLTTMDAGGFWPAGQKPPAVAAVLDELTDPDTARRRLTESEPGPWVIVALSTDVELQGEVRTTELDTDDFSVLVGYGNRKAATHELLRDAYHTVRGIRRSLRQFHRNENAEKRKLENVQIVLCRRIRLLKVELTWRDLPLTGGLVASYVVRELAP